jgi:hypothetical protein
MALCCGFQTTTKKKKSIFKCFFFICVVQVSRGSLQFILGASAGKDTGVRVRGVQELHSTINNLPIAILIRSILGGLVLLLKGLAPWSDIDRRHGLLPNSSRFRHPRVAVSGIGGSSGVIGRGDELHIGVREIRHEVDTLATELWVRRFVVDVCEAEDVVVLDEGVLVLGTADEGRVGEHEAAKDLSVGFDLELLEQDFVEVVFVC